MIAARVGWWTRCLRHLFGLTRVVAFYASRSQSDHLSTIHLSLPSPSAPSPTSIRSTARRHRAEMSSRGLNRRGHLSSKVPNVKLRPSSSALPSKVHEAEPRNAMDQELQRRAWEAGDGKSLKVPLVRHRKWESGWVEGSSLIVNRRGRLVGRSALHSEALGKGHNHIHRCRRQGEVISLKTTIRVLADPTQPHLTELARNLGATITPALTKETTHVVANQFGSAKYLVSSYDKWKLDGS